MNRTIANLLGIAEIAAIVLGIWGAFGTNQHLIVAVDHLNDSAVTVNREKTGTLAEVDKTILAVKSILVHGDMVIAHEDKQLGTLDGYTRNLDTELSGLASHADSTLDSLDGVSAGLTGTANAATVDLQAAQSSIAAFTPLLTHADALTVAFTDTVQTGNGYLKSEAVQSAVKNFSGIAANVNSTTGDIALETHKLTHPPKVKLTFTTAITGGMLWWHSHNPLPPIF